MQYSQAVAVDTGRGTQWSAQDNSDAALVEAIANGDKHALQVLYGRHHVKVFRFALRFLRDESSAEDMVSEVFIDVWRQAERFERRCQVSTWLLAIARNKALSSLRRRSNEQLDDEVAEFIEDPADNPEIVMQKQERNQVLRSCLSELSPAHREIIDLVYYHERSIDEVSEIIGVPANTVKTRMFYARKRIGEMMAARGIERCAM
ncbi:MAG TPA: sigma-70 family RNA polymerase sigma factor [Nitrospiraceae bacterium]|nr:sigma-70 family RNA polymerase sigma factor [Nitrospiraceae bacterium]